MDFSAPSPISAQATMAAHAQARDLPSASKVDPSPTLQEARTDPHTANGQGQSDTTADARQRLEHRERVEDPRTPTGPPPTFQVSQLEVDQDLHNILARLEAERGHDRDGNALRPESTETAPENIENSEPATGSPRTEQAIPALPAPATPRDATDDPNRGEVKPITPQLGMAEAAMPDVFPL